MTGQWEITAEHAQRRVSELEMAMLEIKTLGAREQPQAQVIEDR